MAGQVGLYPQQLGVNPQAGNAMRLASIERRLRQVENQAGFIANGAITGSTTAPGDPTTVTAPGLIKAGAITTAEILAGTITTTNMYAGAVTAKLLQAANIAAGAIVAGHIAAGAIDAMTITGATVRTSASSTRVQMDSTGIYALNAGTVTFAVDAATGKVTTLAGIGGGNLVKNASFENTAMPNLGGFAATLSSVTTPTFHGTRAARATATSASSTQFIVDGTIAAGDRFPVTPGEEITYSVYVFPATVGKNYSVGARFFTAGGGFVSQPGVTTFCPAGQWTRITATLTVPATVAYSGWQITWTSPAIGDVTTIDAFQAERGRIVTAFKPKEDEVLPGTITGGSGTGEIAAGTVTGPDVYSGATTSFLIQANNIAANAITAGKIAAGAIDAMTITGATIRTAASGARVELSGSSLKAYDAGGAVTFDIAAAQPQPKLVTGIGNQQGPLGGVYAFWGGFSTSIDVPNGKTLYVLCSGLVTRSTTTGDYVFVRPEISGNEGREYSINPPPYGGNGAAQFVVPHSRLNNTGSTQSWLVQLKAYSLSGAASHLDGGSGYILAMVF